MLRREGYAGPVTLIGVDPSAPYDRPNLSKDYLAGNAPDEWIPLRPPGFYEEREICSARRACAGDRPRCADAPGGRRLGVLRRAAARHRRDAGEAAGVDLADVHTCARSPTAARIIAAAAGRRAVVIGASFIGLEIAASLARAVSRCTWSRRRRCRWSACWAQELGGADPQPARRARRDLPPRGRGDGDRCPTA